MFISSIYRITVLQYSYKCAASSAAYLCNRYLQNHWVTLHLCVFSLKCGLCLLGLLTELLGDITHGFVALSVASISNLYLHNCWVTLHFLASSVKCNLCLLGLSTESLDYARRLGAKNKVQPMLVSSPYRITKLHYRNGCPTWGVAYFCNFHLRNQWVTLHLLVSMLTLIGIHAYSTLPVESVVYTKLMGVQR